MEQAYYFIKFIFHKDRFHPKKNEYIVPILKQQDDTDDKSFLKIAKGIVRHILSKRKESADSYLDLKALKGMIIYVEVLLNMITDEEIKKKELARVKLIDKGLTQEVELLRPVLLPNFKDFFDDFKSWSVIVFAIITPFIITSHHQYANLKTYILDMALPYYGYGMLGLIVIIFIVKFLFQQQSYKSCFFTKKIVNIVEWLRLKVKQKSKPNLSENLFYKRVFPRFIDLEMQFLRIKLNLKKIIFILFSTVLTAFLIKGFILLMSNYEKQDLKLQYPKCSQLSAQLDELNGTIDLNNTLKTYLMTPVLPKNIK